MSAEIQSLLDLVAKSDLLHQGGEADIYWVLVKERMYTLKWYKAKNAFDCATIEKLTTLHDDGLYRIREFGERDNHSYVLYDYIQGVAISELQLPTVVALFALRKLITTLEFLKSRLLFHGDLNPGNIVLTNNDGSLQPVLIDCGIMGPGALAYAAPERFQGKPADEKSDLYSLGMLLFRMITRLELVRANGFDDYASISMDIDSHDPSKELYASGNFTVEEISALAPIWKATIRANADDRAEDLDELDELLEIALNKLTAGEMAVQNEVQNFARCEFLEKSLQKVPEDGENALPYEIRGAQKKFWYRKKVLLLAVILILSLLAVFLLKSEKSKVDDAGDFVLKKSRSLESLENIADSVPLEKLDRSVDENLLKDLPTPELQE